MNRKIPDHENEENRRREVAADPNGSENIFREALAASPFGVLVHNAAGRILLFNSRLEQITGHTASEVPDIPTWLRRVYPNEEYRKIVLAEPRDEAPAGTTRVRESMITRRDGSACLCRFTSARQPSGLRVVFIQPIEAPAAPAASPAESEARFRFLHQSSPLPTLLWIRQAGDFVLVSYDAAAQNLLGNRLALSLGQPHTDLFASQPEVYDCMRRCLTENRTLNIESWTRREGGDAEKCLRLTFMYAAPNLVLVNAEDVTRLKQAEEEVLRKEERFQELVNLLPETVYEMDATGRILFLNRNGYERFGVTPEDVERGFYPIELLIPEDRERARQSVARVLDGTYSGPNDYTAILKDGRRVSHLAHSRPIVRDGRVVGSRGLIIDTTEQRKLEASLRDNEERLRLAVEAAQIGIYTTDLETDNRQWSAEMYAIAGQRPGNLKTDEEAWSIVHPEDRARVLETHRRALDPKSSGDFYSEHRIVRPDGEVRWIVWRGRTFFRETASGRVPSRRLGACIDITERKLAEEGLLKSKQELEERIKHRTATLEELNENLRNEISARRAVEDELRARTEELAEINNALRVVLRKSREESEENARKIIASIRELAFPHLEKLKLARPTGRQAAYLQLLEEALSEITSSESSSLSDLQRKLTPSEYQVAVLIRQGKTSKQLSEIMSLSCRTIESHRKSIRKKLGLQYSKTNLRSLLASIGNNSQS